MNTLSVIIITFNEERNIRRCLDSIVPVADEIIVVDSFSTDATERLCRPYAHMYFVRHPWEGYVGQKNYGNSIASCDLILSIDADEALSKKLIKSIQKIKNQDIENKAFAMNRLMNYCGKWIRHCGWYPDAKVRIFARGRAEWTGKKVHETLSLAEPTEIVHLDGDLLHYSFYTVDEHRRQNEKFARLSAEEIAEAGKKVTLFKAGTHAAWRFFRDFIFKGGFLDGHTGLTICKINARGVWLKYKMAIELTQNQAK
jgi:glycosyltransferase involved in cell wall biosynthesis